MRKFGSLFFLTLLILFFRDNIASADIISNETFSLYGDFRARLETDWNSIRANGVNRSDRTRARVRGRIGLKITPFDKFTINIRLRTGSNRSQQSPHITVIDFDDNPKGRFNANLDKWFGQFKSGGFTVWGGKNSLNFWKQNEMFWDDDVTVMGGAVSFSTNITDKTKLDLKGGFYRLPVGQQNFSGNLGSGQIVLSLDGKKAALIFAGGVLAIDADIKDADAPVLLNGNGLRDYLLLIGSIQAKIPLEGKMPVTLGFDFMHNTKTYGATDAFGVANNSEKDGFVFSVKYGQLSNKGDWLLAYYYARVETLAVNSSYAQDDWVRWGSATETRATNLKGHEFRAASAFTPKINLVARLYIAKAITTVENGNRFRMDLNVKF